MELKTLYAQIHVTMKGFSMQKHGPLGQSVNGDK